MRKAPCGTGNDSGLTVTWRRGRLSEALTSARAGRPAGTTPERSPGDADTDCQVPAPDRRVRRGQGQVCASAALLTGMRCRGDQTPASTVETGDASSLVPAGRRRQRSATLAVNQVPSRHRGFDTLPAHGSTSWAQGVVASVRRGSTPSGADLSMDAPGGEPGRVRFPKGHKAPCGTSSPEEQPHGAATGCGVVR